MFGQTPTTTIAPITAVASPITPALLPLTFSSPARLPSSSSYFYYHDDTTYTLLLLNPTLLAFILLTVDALY